MAGVETVSASSRRHIRTPISRFVPATAGPTGFPLTVTAKSSEPACQPATKTRHDSAKQRDALRVFGVLYCLLRSASHPFEKVQVLDSVDTSPFRKN